MMIWGKVIGAILGYLVAKGYGAVIGLLIGHMFDIGLNQQWLVESLFTSKAKREKIQRTFFMTTFAVMGHVAKVGEADKHPSKDELERIMQQLSMTPEMQKLAHKYFEQGKKPNFNLDKTLTQFKKMLRNNKALLKMFIEIQLQAAYMQGVLVDAKRAVLVHTSERLGIDRTLFARLNAMHQAEDRFREYLRRHYYEQFQKMRSSSTTNTAYRVLGVDEKASDAEVKKAYRKLISEHHPDRLIAQGLPEEMIKVATEKTQEIKAAYDAIVEARSKLNL
jgi:DnaJ like chaperone protein